MLELPPASSLPKPKSRADDIFAPHDPTKARFSKAKASSRKRSHGVANATENGSPTGRTTPQNDANEGTQERHASSKMPSIHRLSLNLSLDDRPETSPQEIQIMDLDGDNPVIMYQDRLYSCEWASSIGSDLLFVKRPLEPDPTRKPLHSFKEWDLLGIGAAKLVAAPAAIERKHTVTQRTDLDVDMADPDSNPMGLDNEDMMRQARFLGRVADIKAKKGEPTGNLRTLAKSLLVKPIESVANDRGVGRGSRRATPRRARAARTPSTPSRVGAQVSEQSISTPTPASWADLSDREEGT